LIEKSRLQATLDMQIMARKVSEENTRLRALVTSISQNQRIYSIESCAQPLLDERNFVTHSATKQMDRQLKLHDIKPGNATQTRSKQESRTSAAAMLQLTSTFNDLAGLTYRNVYNTMHHLPPQTVQDYNDCSEIART